MGSSRWRAPVATDNDAAAALVEVGAELQNGFATASQPPAIHDIVMNGWRLRRNGGSCMS